MKQYILNENQWQWLLDNLVDVTDSTVTEKDGKVTIAPNGCDDDSETFCLAAVQTRNIVEQETPLGTLLAEPSFDPDYPGIWVSIREPGSSYENSLALVEVCDHEADTDVPEGDKRIVTRVYGNLIGDAPTRHIIHGTGSDIHEIEEG